MITLKIRNYKIEEKQKLLDALNLATEAFSDVCNRSMRCRECPFKKPCDDIYNARQMLKKEVGECE